MPRIIFAIFGLVLSVCGAAGGSGAPSLDPFYFADNGRLIVVSCSGVYNCNQSFADTSAKTPRSAQSALSYSSCVILVSAGQSNEGGEAPTLYTPTNASAVHNFNPLDGAIYPAADPLLGASALAVGGGQGQGNFLGRLADAIINAGRATCVVLVPTGIGSSKVAMWDTGVLTGRLIGTFKRLIARGFTPSGLIWGQGESDCSGGTLQAAYQASASNLFSTLRSATGWTGPIFVATQSWVGGATCSAIQNAQAALVDHGTPNIWAGPNIDSLTNTSRYDTTHFSDVGNASRATLWQAALQLYGPPF